MFRYDALYVQQRADADAPRLLLLRARAGEVVQWAAVDRLDTSGVGVQRRKNEAKVEAIRRYLQQDARNTLPTALTVALKGSQVESTADSVTCTVTVPSLAEGGQGLVIDGQHRLYGAEAFDPDFMLNVVVILEPSDLEVAFQFLVINNKASKVPTDHIKLLVSSLANSPGERDDLDRRLKTARLSLRGGQAGLVRIVDQDESSPFYESVAWGVEQSPGTTRKELIRPATIETALTAIAQRELLGVEGDDTLLAFFYALWKPVKDVWAESWTEGSRLLSKAGFVAMTQFLLEDITPSIDRSELDGRVPADVRAFVAEKILPRLEPQFWSVHWTASGLDTPAGRQMLVETLQRIRRNIAREDPWYRDISFVEV